MQKILICLMRTLGDVVLGNNLVEETVKKYPGCEITFAVWPEYKEIVDTNPHIKGLIITKNWEVVLQEMASDRYDKVMCPYQANHTDTCWHHLPKHKNGHLVDYYASKCGLEITERRGYMYPSEKDFQEVEQYIKPDVRNIIIHTTSLVESKNWDKFSDLRDELIGYTLDRVAFVPKDAESINLIQIGGPNDEKIKRAEDLRGKLSYNQIATLCSKADMFIGVDSGLAYISEAMNCPTIIIMGMSTQGTSGPIGPNAHYIEPVRPAGCEWPCHSNCKHNNPCIKSVTVETVLTKVKEVLGDGEEKAEK